MMHDPGDMDRLWRLRAFEFLGRAVRGRGEVDHVGASFQISAGLSVCADNFCLVGVLEFESADGERFS